jgi:flagellar basal body-associated protein FliL
MTLFIVLVAFLVLALFVAVVYSLNRGEAAKKKEELRTQQNLDPESWKLGPDETEVRR